MKKVKKAVFIISLFCMSGMAAQNTIGSISKDEKAKLFFEGTKVVSQGGLLANSMKEGIWIAYFPSGKKKSESTYLNDILNGPYISWFENGNKCTEGSYDHNKENGIFKSYYEDGTLQSEKNFDYGILYGKAVE